MEIKNLIIFILLLFPLNSFSADLIAEFNSWSVFNTIQENEKICYMTSAPVHKSGNYSVRAEPYILVTYRGDNISEISVYSGYDYKKNSFVDVNIDGKHQHELFTTEETPRMAWAKDSEEDAKIVDEMMKGVTISAKGTSIKDSYSKDKYSLKGFTQAYEKMKSSCASDNESSASKNQ